MTAKTSIPRSAGRTRPVGRLQPGWWVHLEAVEDGAVDGWEQVKTLIDWSDQTRTIVFTEDVAPGDGNAVRAHRNDEAVTLTGREAAKLGLAADAVAGAR